MSFKEVAFFADVKRKVAKMYRYTITVPKLMVVITLVRPYLLCLKTFYTQKLKFSS